MRVDHIVQYRPRHTARVQQPRRAERSRVGEHVDAQSREAHDRAPRERQPQHELGVVGDPLGKRIDRDEQQARDAVEEAGRRKLHQHTQPREALNARERDRFDRGDGPPGDGPVPCPGDVRIEIAIPEIVDGASRPAHDQRAGEEQHRGG